MTGGGTGGHIYPALEIAGFAQGQGAEVRYLGSLRGQESAACQRSGVAFEGFASAPLVSLRSAQGWRALVALLAASRRAKRSLRRDRPDAVFSTGGYSAAPVVAAARSLGIPYVVHEANSVPGRTNRMFAPRARAFTYVFRATEAYAPAGKGRRTGNPVRTSLRDAAGGRRGEPDFVVVLGGSQGSALLNRVVPEAGRRLEHIRFLHSVGPKNLGAVPSRLPGRYEAKGFLEAAELTDAYQHATLAVGRSGSTLAEFAVFGLPSVLVPFAAAADAHQLHNAREFEAMGAASVLEESEATADALARAISGWLEGPERRAAAAEALRQWDVPDATERIWRILVGDDEA